MQTGLEVEYVGREAGKERGSDGKGKKWTGITREGAKAIVKDYNIMECKLDVLSNVK